MYQYLDQLNSTMIPTYMDHIPEGTSTRPFVHYAQLHLSKRFEAYDFGETENFYRYNTTYPPQYDLGKVNSNGWIRLTFYRIRILLRYAF